MLEHWAQGSQIGFPNLMVSFSQPWGQYKAQHLLVTWGRLNFASTPSIKPLELISTFAPIGMLDLS
jgi:hypothetical protein